MKTICFVTLLSLIAGVATAQSPTSQSAFPSNESEAVRVNDLDFQIVAPSTWLMPTNEKGTLIPIALKISNHGERDMKVSGDASATIVLKDSAGKELPASGGSDDQPAVSPAQPAFAINKGQSITVDRNAQLRRANDKAGTYWLAGNIGMAFWRFDGLAPGKYTVAITYENADAGPKEAPNWVGKVTTSALAIEITDKPATQPAARTIPEGPDLIMRMPPPEPPQNVRMRISNQSLTISPIQITVKIDGKEALTKTFEVGNQHNYESFWLTLPEREFVFSVESKTTKASLEQKVTITPTQRFIDITFSTDPDPKFSLQVADENRKTD